MIRVEGLCKSYGDVEILKNVSVEINKGEVISIIGPSGSGKSTFLRCLNLLEQPTGGKIFVDGTDITADKKNLYKLRRRMGMVFQTFNLFSHLMVVENVMLGPVKLLHISRQAAYEEAMRLLETVGLAGKAFAYPDELSGGQKQRAEIARVLSMKPEIILFDEPTTALDPRMTSEVLAVIRKLAKDGMTMVIVTHEMNFARTISTRVFYIDEKGIYEDGPPEQIFENPVKPKTKRFIYNIRSYNYLICGKQFDFYEFIAGMEVFLLSEGVKQKRIRTLSLVSEEVIFNLFLNKPENGNMNLEYVLRYSEHKDSAEIEFSHESIDNNFLNTCQDRLAMKIIQRYAKEIRCERGVLSILI